MRISDWSSDVCSSDLFSVLSGGDENQILRLRNGLTPTGSRAGRRTGVSRVRGRRRENPTIRRTSIALAMARPRSEEHTSELQSLMRISYAVFCLKKKKTQTNTNSRYHKHQERTIHLQINNNKKLKIK